MEQKNVDLDPITKRSKSLAVKNITVRGALAL